MHIRGDQQVCVIDILRLLFFSCEVCKLFSYLCNVATVFFDRLLIGRNDHSDHNVGTHAPGEINRVVVDHSPVNQQHAVFLHRREDSRQGHAGSDGFRQDALPENHLLTGAYIGSYTSEGCR